DIEFPPTSTKYLEVVRLALVEPAQSTSEPMVISHNREEKSSKSLWPQMRRTKGRSRSSRRAKSNKEVGTKEESSMILLARTGTCSVTIMDC
ncbi:hypothetical protein CR513_24059, partial [Mucuna pruriens]